MKVDSGSILNFLGKIENAPKELSQVLNVGYLLIAIGAILLITGFLGCCGAIRESKCMLLLVGLQLYREQKMKFNIIPFLGASLNIKIHTNMLVSLLIKCTKRSDLSLLNCYSWCLYIVLRPIILKAKVQKCQTACYLTTKCTAPMAHCPKVPSVPQLLVQ